MRVWLSTSVLGILMLAAGHASADMHRHTPDPEPTPSIPSPATPQQPSVPASAAAELNHGIVATRAIAQRFSPFAGALDLPGAPGFAALGGSTGMAAGDVSGRWSGWVSGNIGSQRDTFVGTASSGTTASIGAGLDWKATQAVTLGVSVTGSRTDQTTRYNGGSSDTDGLTVMPYVAGSLTDWLSYDVALGYSWNRTDQHRTTAGVVVSGDSRADGYVASANLNAARWYGSVLVTAKAGLVASRTARAAFLESDGTLVRSSASDLVQGRFGVGAGYWLAPVLLSTSVTYVNDFDRTDVRLPGAALQPPNDRDGFVLEAGLTLYGTGAAEGLTASLTASTEVGRRKQESFNVGANVRFAF